MTPPPGTTKADLIIEKIPPLISLTLLTLPFWGGYFFPNLTAYFIIIFNVYFFYKASSIGILFTMAFFRIKSHERINWLEKLQGLEDIPGTIEELEKDLERIKQLKWSKTYKVDLNHKISLKERIDKDDIRSLYIINRLPKWLQRFTFFLEKNKVKRFLRNEINELKELSKREDLPNWQDLRHVIIVPYWKEDYPVLKRSIDKIAAQIFPTKRISVVLATEDRWKPAKAIAKRFQEEYKDVFENIWITAHPLKDNEIIGKSSNMNYAARWVSKKVDQLGWDPKLTTVTSCDADSQLPRQYYAYISYEYVKNPERTYKYYWAPVIFYANIWKLPFYLRMKASIDVIGGTSQLFRVDRLHPFSTYVVSLQLLRGINFWNPTSSGEDWDLFMRGLFTFRDKVSVVPIFLKVLADAAEGEGHMDASKNNYFQSRRWYWGISDDKYVIKMIWKLFIEGKLTLYVLYRGLHAIWDHVMVATTGIILLIGGNIPPFISKELQSSVLGSQLPKISSFILQLTAVTFALSLIINFLLQPPRPGKMSLIQKIINPFMWLLNPVVALVFTAVPGLEAHTKLLFGRYLSYYLTKKK